MITPKKIFLGIIAFLIFIFLIYSSYIYKKATTNFEKPEIKYTHNGKYYLDKKYNLTQKGTENNIKIDFLNYADKVLSYKSEIKFDGNNIDLTKGNYLVDVKELNSKYNFSGTGFVIKNNGPTSFYVDNSLKKTYIFSINNILEIELIDPKTNLKVNTIYLYPNEYIAFSPSINRIIKSADLLRVSQVFSLNYINENIIKDSNINIKFSDKILFGEEKENLEDMFIYIKNKNKQNENILKNFIKKKKISINGELLIEDYFNFFLNKEKKKIYLKNITIRKLANIMNSTKIKPSDIEYIIKKIADLKELGEVDYKELKNIVLYYSSLFIENEFNDNTKKIEISKLINRLNGENFTFKSMDILDLYNIFSKYNFYNKINIYGEINDFSIKHLSSNIKNTQKGYFIFFLNKFILAGFENITIGKNVNFDDLLNIINNFTNESIKFYQAKDETDSVKKNKIIETGIKTYNEILKKLFISIKQNYFENKLSEKGLLILSEKGKNKDSTKINILKNSIQNIYNFFNKNKNILTNSTINHRTKKEFENTYKVLNMYFEAIMNYEKYRYDYDEVFKNLKDNISIENNNKLDKNSSIDLLKNFNYLDLDNIIVEPKSSEFCYNPIKENDTKNDEFCFQIKNIILSGGLKINFLLYPSLGNKIDYIEINDKKTTGSYVIDQEKEKYKKLNRTIKDGDDKERYKFENFFLYSFNPPQKIENKDIYVGENQNNENNESSIVSSLKSNTLLGKKGTFNIVSDYLDINYNNIIVKETNKNLDIKLQNVNFNYNINENDYYGIFNSDYIFKKGVANSFKNPKITFTDNSKNSLLNGNSIIMSGFFPLNNFKKDLENVILNLKNINKITDAIYTTNNENNLSITYSKYSNKFLIKSDSLSISIKGIIIEQIIYKGKNLLTKPDKIDNLYKHLNNLK